MSLFVETGQIDPNKNYLEDLVGENKPYKTPVDLARAAVEKELHIKQVEKENQKLREDLNARVKEEDLYDKISTLLTKSPSTEQNTNADGNGTNKQSTTVGVTPEQFDELLDKRLKAKEAERQTQANQELVRSKLVEKFGTNFVSPLKDVVQKLGVKEDFLERVAAENPNAFFRIVGIEDKQPVGLFTPPPSSTDIGFKPKTNQDRTQAYYKELRKRDPVLYNSREVQIQEEKDARRLGEAFFDA